MFFTRTTLFTTMFTAIIVVCSLKSMCIPSFIVIGYCLSELYSIYVPMVMYGLRLFIVNVVLQELHVVIIGDVSFGHFIRFRCSTPSGF